MNIDLIKVPSKTFLWKDRKDNFHIPANMDIYLSSKYKVRLSTMEVV